MDKLESIENAQKELRRIACGLNKEDGEVLIFACKLLDESVSLEKKRIEAESRPVGSHTRWTEKEEAELTDDYKNGDSVEELAKAHERSLSGIISRLTKLELLPVGELNGGRRWSDEEESKLKSEYAKGKSLAEISSAHGRSMAGIVARLVKLGLAE